MKKNYLSVGLLVLSSFGLFACNNDKPSNNSTNQTKYIDVDPLQIEGFDNQYLPVKEKIVKRQGNINVCLEFDGTEEAYKSVAQEYMRLHGGSVNVSIKEYTGAYSDYITNQMNTLDIVQGNFINNIENYCLNMYQDIYKENPYAGKNSDDEINYWSDVLTEEAYVSSKSATNATYILNSENLQTAWFVNKTALNEAVEYGYNVRNENNEIVNPRTWDELIQLCEAMYQAGYKHPLGISLNDESIDSIQFTWLLRVYGDFYYRNEYKNIVTNSGYEYDPTDKNPETDGDWSIKDTVFYNSLLDDRQGDDRPYIQGSQNKTNYVGATSGKYKEFLEQLYKMRKYLASDASQTNYSLNEVRNRFAYQTRGKENSPQIILDYAGEGLLFAKSKNIDYDFFDYPRMISEGNYIDEGTIVRDVGGNGGYLSIIKSGKSNEQVNLSLDFIMFLMSPYGQTVYYDALSKTNFAPKGLTTVINDYVVVPSEWESFFRTDKISFNGLVDENPYVISYLRGIGGMNETKDALKNLMRGLLSDVGEDEKSVSEVQTEWQKAYLNAWNGYCDKVGYNKESYKRPGSDVTGK